MTQHCEHLEASRELEIDSLPKQVVTRDGYRQIASEAGWTDEMIDTVLNGTLPARFCQVGSSAVLIVDEDDPAYREAVETQLRKP